MSYSLLYICRFNFCHFHVLTRWPILNIKYSVLSWTLFDASDSLSFFSSSVSKGELGVDGNHVTSFWTLNLDLYLHLTRNIDWPFCNSQPGTEPLSELSILNWTLSNPQSWTDPLSTLNLELKPFRTLNLELSPSIILNLELSPSLTLNLELSRLQPTILNWALF
jgi:hypothetical protein